MSTWTFAKTLAETVHYIPKGLRKGNPFQGPFAQLSNSNIINMSVVVCFVTQLWFAKFILKEDRTNTRPWSNELNIFPPPIDASVGPPASNKIHFVNGLIPI